MAAASLLQRVAREMQPTPQEAGTLLRMLGHEDTLRVPAMTLAERLNDRRWAVMDGGVPPEQISRAADEARQLLRSGALGRQRGLGLLRGDRYAMLQPASPSTPVALAGLLRRLLGAARRLNQSSTLSVPAGRLQPDPQGGMVACYAHGERYARHADRAAGALSRQVGAGFATNAARLLTMILYLAHDEPLPDAAAAPHEGGALRLWPRGGLEAATSGRLSAGIDVEARAGRLVLFDSSLVHEVRPVRGSLRCALTLWVMTNDPQRL